MSHSSENTPCFRGIYHLHFLGLKSKSSKKPAEAGIKFLPHLLFNPEDGGDMLFQNVWLSPNNMVLQLRTPYPPETIFFITK
jgi:hypothetical protein